MPASDLKALREYVANVLDYNPDNAAYASQVDDLLNEANRFICQAKPFTFINKVVEKSVYADVSFDAVANPLTFTNGTQVVTGPVGSFLDWMEGQELDAEGAVYTINNVVSDTEIRINTDWPNATGTYAGTIINRYIDLPQDCTTVLAVARRSNTRTPDDPGLLSPLARYEDEWWNLPLGEVNLPIYWVFHDPYHQHGPRVLLSASATVSGVGRGVRTVEFCATQVFAGRESPPGEIVTVTAQDNEVFTLTPSVLPTNGGLKKRYYFRAPEHGMKAWRLLNDPTTPGAFMELEPADNTLRNFAGALSLSNLLTNEGLYANPRMLEPDGFTQRIRLYPRQDKDYVFSVRYMQRTPVMREDNDVSLIPPAHRMMIAYKALADVLVKHDNPTQAEMFRRRFEAQQLQLEKRYLITPSRRIVKGNWLTNMEPNSFSRFTTLVHS